MLVYITRERRWGGLGGSIRRLGYCDTWVKRIADERERLRRLSARRGDQGVNFGIFGLFGSPSTPKLETLDIRELPNLKERVEFLINTVLRGSEDAVNELHGLGYRHGSLGEDSVLLKRVNEREVGRREPPGTVRECRGGGVKVAFQDLGFGGPINRAYLDVSLIRRANVFWQGSSLTNLDLGKFAVAEDRHAMGIVWAGVLLGGAMVEGDGGGGGGGGEGGRGERWAQVFQDAFKGNLEEFREYVKEEEGMDTVVELLDERYEGGTGWEVLGGWLRARETWGKGEEWGGGWGEVGEGGGNR
ncbi:hypothetical protein TrCOL_g11338 [Triparma columacea]|uniref:Uncharacterized protein n=1 Tax=Triparma columacea TaxID=722753 RepID=A0A9W7LAC0_9STRA|nr:hypothetical protein TrCOL_g11338 [Triparma columacea]